MKITTLFLYNTFYFKNGTQLKKEKEGATHSITRLQAECCYTEFFILSVGKLGVILMSVFYAE